MAEREIRYCTTGDGVSIAYSVEGDRQETPLVWIPGWVSHLEIDGQTRDALGLTEILRPVRFITFDKRGSGLSSRNVTAFSLDAHLTDAAAVVSDLGLDQFALAGYSEGGPVAIAFAAQYPERVTRLTIVGSFADGSRLMGSAEMNQAVLAAVRAEWGIGSQFMADLFLAEDSYAPVASVASYQRLGADPIAAHAAFEFILSLDIRPLLSLVTSPTLVLHTRDDRAVPLELGQEIAASIRGARFSSFPGAHYPSRDVWKQINRSMVEFVTGQPQMPPPPSDRAPVPVSGVTIILFADIAGSTALTERLGDAAFRAKARDLDAALRERVRANSGSVIDAKTLGDGILATFPAAAQAIAAALSFESAASDVGLALHVGLHAGDVIREQDNVFGGAVNIAARISGLSPPGEVLVSDVVRALARTSASVTFEDRGEHALKGVGEPQRVFRIRPGTH